MMFVYIDTLNWKCSWTELLSSESDWTLGWPQAEGITHTQATHVSNGLFTLPGNLFQIVVQCQQTNPQSTVCELQNPIQKCTLKKPHTDAVFCVSMRIKRFHSLLRRRRFFTIQIHRYRRRKRHVSAITSPVCLSIPRCFRLLEVTRYTMMMSFP